MENITLYYTSPDKYASHNFEDAFHHVSLRYSLRHLTFAEDLSDELIRQALQKSIQICYLLEINSRHHFKKIYISNPIDGTVHVDWLMSKRGFNLMVMQIPSLSEKRAKWLWALTDQ